MQIRWYLLTILLVIGGHAGGQNENATFRVERHEVVYSDGHTVDRRYVLYPEQRETELAFEQRIHESDTRTLRIHFQIEADPAGSIWFVETSGPDQSAWRSTDAARLRGEFWSDEIVGDHADVVLHIVKGARDVKIRIDKLAVTGVESKPQSITTRREDIVPILGEPNDIKTLGRAIARIRFIGDDGGQYFCTGFLVGADVLMTNEHCFSSPKEATSALVDFDFDAPDMKPKTVGISDLLWNNFDLDYALARLAPSPPDNRPAVALAARSIHLGQDLMVIQHPEGQFKQVSLINCLVSGENLVVGRGQSKTDISHLCNTVGGSSGSAVWDRHTHEVIGLHHFGFYKGATKPSNQAVDMGAILEDVYARDPKVYRSLTIVNPKHSKQ